MDFVIAIPSLGRYESLPEKTIRVLQEYQIPSEKIFVFCVSEEEQFYKPALPEGVTLVVGVKGLVNQREYIHNYFPVGTNILFLDDDITGLIGLDKKPIPSLSDLIQTGFKVCRDSGSRLWGIYPVSNPFFMDQTVSKSLKYIVGCFYGCVNTIDRPVIPLDQKEDFYRSCAYYKADGVVVRVNYVAVKTTYYKGKGGLVASRTIENNLEGAKRVCADFPDMATLWTRKTTGYAEVRLRFTIKKH